MKMRRETSTFRKTSLHPPKVSSFTYHNTRTGHKTVILTLLGVGTINIITKNKKNIYIYYISFQNPTFLIFTRLGMLCGHSIQIYVFTHYSSPPDVTTIGYGTLQAGCLEVNRVASRCIEEI